MENQNTKGFTLLELIVVVAIIGAISAAGIPNFLTWSADRNVRSANENTAGLITTLNTQTQRGTYPFTQILITPQNNTVVIEAKGKTKRSINELRNNGDALICDTDNSYWDGDPISRFIFDDIFVHFENESAICFSKDAADYDVTGEIVDNENNPLQTNNGVPTTNYLIFCTSRDNCGITPERPAYMVVWSRFGNVSKFKYNSNNQWIMQ